jgi:hypothetical protein
MSKDDSMFPALEKVHRQVECYAANANEIWREHHQEAMDCLEVECEVEMALHLFNLLKRTVEMVEDAIRRDRFPEDPRILQLGADSFQQWLTRSEAVEARVRAFESRGFDVRRANDLRSACDRVRRQCFDMPGTAVALAQVTEKKTVPLDALANALQDRSHGKGG